MDLFDDDFFAVGSVGGVDTDSSCVDGFMCFRDADSAHPEAGGTADAEGRGTHLSDQALLKNVGGASQEDGYADNAHHVERAPSADAFDHDAPFLVHYWQRVPSRILPTCLAALFGAPLVTVILA